MHCAMCTSFSKQIFNIIFIITEQGNKVQNACASEVASSAAIIICKSIFYIPSDQTFSKMPIIVIVIGTSGSVLLLLCVC